MVAPREILQLVERFERNADEYRALGYNEANVRQEFINPLFERLGWDLDNRRGAAEAYKDVVHEAALKTGEPTGPMHTSVWRADHGQACGCRH